MECSSGGGGCQGPRPLGRDHWGPKGLPPMGKEQGSLHGVACCFWGENPNHRAQALSQEMRPCRPVSS